MDHTTMLVDLLKLHFGWHLARVKCLSYFIVALFKVKTVNLAELATAFPGTANVESHYKRLQRFLKHVDLQSPVVAQFVAAFVPHEAYTLSLDRTGIPVKRDNLVSAMYSTGLNSRTSLVTP